MFIEAHSPVNEAGALLPPPVIAETVASQLSLPVPVPGEDGEPQSVSALVLDCGIVLTILALLFIWWPILQGVRL